MKITIQTTDTGSTIAATRLNTAYDLRLPIGAADVSALIASICQDPEKIEAHSGPVMAVRTKDGIDLRTNVGSFSLPWEMLWSIEGLPT